MNFVVTEHRYAMECYNFDSYEQAANWWFGDERLAMMQSSCPNQQGSGYDFINNYNNNGGSDFARDFAVWNWDMNYISYYNPEINQIVENIANSNVFQNA